MDLSPQATRQKMLASYMLGANTQNDSLCVGRLNDYQALLLWCKYRICDLYAVCHYLAKHFIFWRERETETDRQTDRQRQKQTRANILFLLYFLPFFSFLLPSFRSDVDTKEYLRVHL